MIAKFPTNKMRLIIFIFTVILIVGFSVQPVAGEKPFYCGDGPRYKIEVKEFAIKYSNKSFEGTFGLLSKLKLGLQVEDKTLQKAAESTQQWNQLLIGIAEGYNSCAITKKQYHEAICTLYPGMQTDAQKMLDIGKALDEGQPADLEELKRSLDEYFQKLKKFAEISGKEEIVERISDKVEQEHERTRRLFEEKFDLLLAEIKESKEKDRILQDKESIIAELKQKLQETEKELQKRGASEALAQFKQGNYEEAERLFQKERQEKRTESASAAYYLGNIRFAELDFKAAELYYVEAAELDPNNTEYINMAGRVVDVLGKHLEAVNYYEQALAIDKKVYDDQHPNVATYLNNLGLAWYYSGEYKKAIKLLEQALAIGKKVYDDQHPNVATYLSNLGLAWNSLGEYKKAIKLLEQALAIGKKVYGDQHPNVATYLNNLGSTWNSLGEYKKAIKLLEQAESIFLNTLGEDHPYTKSMKNKIESAKQRAS